MTAGSRSYARTGNTIGKQNLTKFNFDLYVLKKKRKRVFDLFFVFVFGVFVSVSVFFFT